MRSFRTLIQDLAQKPPILFPLVALFHIVWLCYITGTTFGNPFPSIIWLQPLWMLCYTICWPGCCDMRRWGALGYLGLTVIDIILYFAIKNPTDRDLLSSPLFLIDVLFSFFIFVYYKRFS